MVRGDGHRWLSRCLRLLRHLSWGFGLGLMGMGRCRLHVIESSVILKGHRKARTVSQHWQQVESSFIPQRQGDIERYLPMMNMPSVQKSMSRIWLSLKKLCTRSSASSPSMLGTFVLKPSSEGWS